LAERQEKVIKQLTSLFGKDAENYLAYHEKVWREEELTLCHMKSWLWLIKITVIEHTRNRCIQQ
jgi:hypothetical protein